MTEGASGRVACPSCGKQYGWKAGYARLAVKCNACECRFRMPAKSVGKAIVIEKPVTVTITKLPEISRNSGSVSGYELDGPKPPQDTSTEKANMAPGSSCADQIRVEAILCTNCGFNLKTGKKVSTKVR